MLLKLLSSLVLSTNVLAIIGSNVVSNSAVNKNKLEKVNQDISVNIGSYQQIKKWFANFENGSKNWIDTIENDFILHNFKDEGFSNINEIQKSYKEIKFNPNLIYLQAKGLENSVDENGNVLTIPMFDSELKTNNNSSIISINDIVIKKGSDDPSPNTEVMELEYNVSFKSVSGTSYSHSMIYLEIYFKEETKLYGKLITNYDLTTYYSGTIWGSGYANSSLYLESYSTNGIAQIIAN